MKIKYLLLTILFGILMFIPIVCNADVYYVSKEDVNLRSTPQVTSGNIIMSIKRGSTVQLLSESKTWGGSCSSGWYNISYSGNTGYVCSGYIAYGNPANETDEYLRPWISPKKAIVGGAKYIAASYISKGQFTSYLKKFNVNPNSSYSKYNHQYMANLAAPSTEATTSYNSYKENGMLSLPLEFSIPIYNGMPDYTALPGKAADTSCQSEVTDWAFEESLNAQGFPESYKCKLRLLHNTYPNWVFRSMNTNLDFNTSVNAEQGVSSIQGGDIYYKMPKVQTENGWYLANTETVAYYLDPRNFLNDKKILMFEDLGYKDYYTESTITPILKGTFMEGYSLIDNQTYASIFVEAGNTARMSSVYLASLARQESGSKGSRATSGAEFTYQGTTYKGLYNFYNIGANSSAENPILAGLVWATGGFDVSGMIGNIPASTNPESGNIGTAVSSVGAKVTGDYIASLPVGLSVGDLKSKLSGYSVSSSLGDGDVVRTGATINIANAEATYQYTMVVSGDVDGDGQMLATDYVKIKNYIMEVAGSGLNTAQSLAADVDNNGQIGATDYVLIKNNIMGR